MLAVTRDIIQVNARLTYSGWPVIESISPVEVG